jgi:hypothetical protein
MNSIFTHLVEQAIIFTHFITFFYEIEDGSSVKFQMEIKTHVVFWTPIKFFFDLIV